MVDADVCAAKCWLLCLPTDDADDSEELLHYTEAS
jgi:hypothetical protein